MNDWASFGSAGCAWSGWSAGTPRRRPTPSRRRGWVSGSVAGEFGCCPFGAGVGEQRVGAADEGEVVAKVGCRFGQVHRLEGEPGGDALVEGGEDAHAKLAGEG